MNNNLYFEDKRNNKLNNKLNSEHWMYCEKNSLPYITIESHNKEYDTIFYDITNLKYDLGSISENIKSIYSSYIIFFLIPYIEVEDCFEQFYFFYFYVKKNHSICVAENLFKFILSK